jgi:hypothetical protein
MIVPTWTQFPSSHNTEVPSAARDVEELASGRPVSQPYGLFKYEKGFRNLPDRIGAAWMP